MTINEAVDAAKRGEEKGYQFLYESTYSYHFYLAGKYLRDDQDAVQDVLQESYIKAFRNLNQLQDPEHFSGWLSTIVTRTALNELRKRKNILFSQMQDEEGDFDISDRFESDRTDVQPELSFDEAETKRLLKEMLDALSDEQRICMIMYYFEELSVKEIAEILAVSENTVKSRLNYGRKNLKGKVLELEKKGTKLYSVLPIPLFLLLFRSEAKACEAQIAVSGFESVRKALNLGSGNIGSGMKESIDKGTTAKVVKSVALGSMKYKILAGILTVGVATGGIVTAAKVINKPQSVTKNDSVADIAEVTEIPQEPVISEESVTLEDTVEPDWETYECMPEVANLSEDIFDWGIMIKVRMRTDESLKTDIVGFPTCFFENPEIQIDDKVFYLDKTTLAQMLESYRGDDKYSMELVGRGDEKELSDHTEIHRYMEILIKKYGEEYAYVYFGNDDLGSSSYTTDDVYLYEVKPATQTSVSFQNIWFQGGFRADGGNLTCSDLEELFEEKGLVVIDSDAGDEERPDYITDEMVRIGETNILTHNAAKCRYSKTVNIIYDSPEEFRLKRCHYSFEYDPSTQEITGISLTTDGEYLYPNIKFRVEGKDSYTSYYLECKNYRTELTKEQQENKVLDYGELCKMENGLLEENEEMPDNPAGGDDLTYKGELIFKTNNGDGTYVCSDGQTDYVLGISDNAKMYMTSFSESADENFQIVVPGSAFKQLQFGYETTYEGSQLYDFNDAFCGDAVVENGQITYFNEYFRE